MKRVAALVISAALLAAAPALAEPPKVSDFAWMIGSWVEQKDGMTVRETWLPAMGGQMVGVGQAGRPGERASYEFERIEAADGAIVFTAVLEGQPPTPFTLIPSQPGEAIFENKAHDFPQRVIYHRCGDDLCARIEGKVGGKVRFQEWRYHRE